MTERRWSDTAQRTGSVREKEEEEDREDADHARSDVWETASISSTSDEYRSIVGECARSRREAQLPAMCEIDPPRPPNMHQGGTPATSEEIVSHIVLRWSDKLGRSVTRDSSTPIPP